MAKVEEVMSPDGGRMVSVGEDGVSVDRPATLAEQVAFLAETLSDYITRAIPLARQGSVSVSGKGDNAVLTITLSAVDAPAPPDVGSDDVARQEPAAGSKVRSVSGTRGA